MMARAAAYAILIFATSVMGGLLPIYRKSTTEAHTRRWISLGAGILLGTTFVHMLPHAEELLPGWSYHFFLLGFVLLLIVERFIMVHACDESHCHYHTVGWTAFAGLVVHGIIEGMALGSTLAVVHLSSLVFFAIAAHKVPSGFALASILRMAGKSRKQITAFVIWTALSGPVGILLALLIMRNTSTDRVTGALLAISAGTFLYISACDLLPEVHRNEEGRGERFLYFLLGLALSYTSILLH